MTIRTYVEVLQPVRTSYRYLKVLQGPLYRYLKELDYGGSMAARRAIRTTSVKKAEDSTVQPLGQGRVGVHYSYIV